MKTKNKLILYVLLLISGLAIFICELFIFQKPDGIAGLIICIACIYMIFGSIIKLCKLSKKIADALPYFLDLLFWLP